MKLRGLVPNFHIHDHVGIVNKAVSFFSVNICFEQCLWSATLYDV